jgi:type IV pilus assembly protein PilC
MNKNKKIKFTINEQIRLARRVAALLGSGMGIAEALSFVERSLSGNRKKVMVGIIMEVSHGHMCSEIFSATGSFDRSLVHMIAIGEKSGSLETAFAQAALLLEKRQALSRKIYGALIYPGFIACATAGIALFLVVYIFPKIIPLITSMNIPLPFLTRMLIFISHILIYDWLAVVSVCVFGSLCGFVVWKYVKLARRAAGVLVMILPFAGGIMRSKILIQIFKPLGLLLSHGEHIPEALQSVAGIVNNDEYSESLRAIALQVGRGKSFAGCVTGQSHLFPLLVIDFLETGERTGGIAVACEHIANLYESEVDESVKRISTVIEPVLMLGMGIIVGGIALSIVMPIYEITSYLSK